MQDDWSCFRVPKQKTFNCTARHAHPLIPIETVVNSIFQENSQTVSRISPRLSPQCVDRLTDLNNVNQLSQIHLKANSEKAHTLAPIGNPCFKKGHNPGNKLINIHSPLITLRNTRLIHRFSHTFRPSSIQTVSGYC